MHWHLDLHYLGMDYCDGQQHYPSLVTRLALLTATSMRIVWWILFREDLVQRESH